MTSARRLLARLREVMAGSGAVQARLDKIVQLIAAEMVAEVCSIYVLRAGELLELFATVGLNPQAIHRTRLAVGEGLVGSVAAAASPLALADAQAHPRFAYRPETGEDPYHSFLGVPVLREGRVRGVLVIQNQQRRIYADDEIETLQTIAMVAAELLVASDVLSPAERAAISNASTEVLRLRGAGLNGGIAIGHAVLHRPPVLVRELVARDVGQEIERLEQALAGTLAALDRLIAQARSTDQSEPLDILQAHRLVAGDRSFAGQLRAAVRLGLTAEAAVMRVLDDLRARLGRAPTPELRERLLDLEDVAHRLLGELDGKGDLAGRATLPDDTILIARQLGPAALLDYDRAKLRALVLEEGGQASHVAIVARALDIPLVGRCVGAAGRIEPLDLLVVDGDQGLVVIRPGEDVVATYQVSQRERRVRQSRYRADRDLPTVTRDGTAVTLLINAGLPGDLAALEETGAAGVGLYRTEIGAMMRTQKLSLAAERAIYAEVLDRAGGRPVCFRTYDVGGDKNVPWLALPEEDNPALGWRGLRLTLDRPVLLRRQMRALLEAHAGGQAEIMLPMVSEVAEIHAARALLDRELAALPAQRRPRAVTLGAMLEVPSLLFDLPRLMQAADFIAIGSNDLTQYMFAADRDNGRVGQRFDPLNPAFLQAVRTIVAAAEAAGRPVCVCGEMAGRPIDALALMALGIRRLSVGASSVGPVKAAIRTLDLSRLTRYVDACLERGERRLRSALAAYAVDRGIELPVGGSAADTASQSTLV